MAKQLSPVIFGYRLLQHFARINILYGIFKCRLCLPGFTQMHSGDCAGTAEVKLPHTQHMGDYLNYK